MFVIYGDFELTNIELIGSSFGAVWRTDDNGAALNDFHTGLVSTASWIAGAQTTASFLDIKFQTSADYIGGVGLFNVQGLPEGLLTELLSSDSSGETSLGTQPLRQGPDGNLQAVYLPMLGAGEKELRLRLHNNVNGVAKVAASATWGAGELLAGWAIYLPTMLARQPSSQPTDPTANVTQDAGSVFPTFRKPARTVNATLGPFASLDVGSTLLSSIDDGHGGKISLRRLQDIFLRANGTAVCDIASAGKGAGVVRVGKGRIDQEAMQENWMLARIQNQGGQITMDQPPKWSWPTSWRQTI